ncbi:MAG: RagB/SusD family nutrient uptake outer membrane protein, partial [Marinilabiliales bacterium]
MKITINKLGILLAMVFLFTACKKEFLDRPPLDTDVSTNFYKTEQDAMLALVAVYDVLGYQSTPGVSWAPFLTMSDILSDDAFAGGSDANDGKDEDEFNNFDIPTSSLIAHSIWLKNYTGIYRANLLLEKIGDIEASEEFKSRIIGECKFMRAYFYLEQVRFFENIPLLTETIKGPSEYIQPQATPEEVYNQIAADLVDAYN